VPGRIPATAGVQAQPAGHAAANTGGGIQVDTPDGLRAALREAVGARTQRDDGARFRFAQRGAQAVRRVDLDAAPGVRCGVPGRLRLDAGRCGDAHGRVRAAAVERQQELLDALAGASDGRIVAAGAVFDIRCKGARCQADAVDGGESQRARADDDERARGQAAPDPGLHADLGVKLMRWP
jgi:hypothetical protein